MVHLEGDQLYIIILNKIGSHQLNGMCLSTLSMDASPSCVTYTKLFINHNIVWDSNQTPGERKTLSHNTHNMQHNADLKKPICAFIPLFGT